MGGVRIEEDEKVEEDAVEDDADKGCEEDGIAEAAEWVDDAEAEGERREIPKSFSTASASS